MKKYLKILLPLILLTLTACRNDSSSDSINSSSAESSTIMSSLEPTTSETPIDSSTVSSEELGEERILNFYALNDFHGAILETENDPGLFRYSTYLKSKIAANPNGTIHLNAGDLWQGSIESNMNRGEFITKAMNELSLDAFALGNHEFDWYDTAIMNNKAIAEFPFLGANIMHKATGEIADNIVHYDDTFKASHMVNKNGVNVGIIGTIGSDLESSILGLAIADYSFEPVTSYVKSEAANLRALGADIVVLVTHDSLTNFSMSATYNEYYEIFNDKHVDIVFSGHHHTEDNRVLNGIPVLQAWAYGGGVMELELNYNVNTKEKTFTHQTVLSSRVVKTYAEDPAMLALFDPYEQSMEAIKNEVVGTLNKDITKEGLLNVANKVIYDYGVDAELDNVVALHNRAGVRLNYGIPQGDVIFGDIYRAFPFDNEIMVIPNITGTELNNFIRGDYKGYPAKGPGYDTSKTYTLVTLDFISYREGAFTLDREQISTKLYVRDLIGDYFRNTGTIDANYFNSY